MRINDLEYLKKNSSEHSVKQLSDFLDLFLFRTDVLFVWDLDYTLVGPNDPTFDMCNIAKNKSSFFEAIKKFDTLTQALFLNYMCYRVNTRLLSVDFRKIFENFSIHECRRVALSSMAWGDVLDIPSAHEKRVSQLNEVGIYFSDLPLSENNELLHFKGCIFSNSVLFEGKAEALQLYLKHTKLNITTIIYIDDNLDNYLEVTKHLGSKYDIQFFEFLGAFDPHNTLMEKGDFETNLKQFVQEFERKIGRLL